MMSVEFHVFTGWSQMKGEIFQSWCERRRISFTCWVSDGLEFIFMINFFLFFSSNCCFPLISYIELFIFLNKFLYKADRHNNSFVFFQCKILDGLSLRKYFYLMKNCQINHIKSKKILLNWNKKSFMVWLGLKNHFF